MEVVWVCWEVRCREKKEINEAYLILTSVYIRFTDDAVLLLREKIQTRSESCGTSLQTAHLTSCTILTMARKLR